MEPSQNLLLPPRKYPPFLQLYICNTPIIYPSSQNTPSLNIYLLPSENLPLPPRIYPFFICEPPRIYPLIIHPPLNIYMLPSQNRPLPPRIYPSFTIYMRPSENLPRPVYTHNYIWHSHNPPLPSRSYPRFLQSEAGTPRIHPTLQKYAPFLNIYMRPSQDLLTLPHIYYIFLFVWIVK